MTLILFGFKGCGKTHFGKKLAQQVHFRFVDTDDLISDLFEKNTKKKRTCREIYQEIGKEGFRALEKEAIKSLKDQKECIIALGGGAILDPDNLEILETIGTLVYLRTDEKTLQERIFHKPLPAFFDENDPQVSFMKIFREREPIYESIQAVKIDCSVLDEAGVLSALKALVYS